MTERITAAARALCKLASIECGVNEQDNWNVYSAMFKKDAAAAIKAADKVAKADADAVLVKKVSELQEQVNFYRSKFGVVA